MCGRFAQGFAIRAVAEQLERGELGIDDVRELDNHYPSFNVAPTTYQAVYRRDRSDDHTMSGTNGQTAETMTRELGGTASTPDTGASEANLDQASTGATRHVLQGMKWGLIPFWTKRAPETASQLKTINCRDDSLLENRGMWNSMKGRKRCIVPVQGYYEWQKKGPKEKIPHFTKRKDGQMMMLAGLYDCVQYDGSTEKLWTFTIITTAAKSELSWLHDRMPLILEPGTEEIRHWLDDDTWSPELIKLLQPYRGDLECYPVKREVGKVGNNSPDFIIPLDSKENKSNIANFFHKQEGSASSPASGSPVKSEHKEVEIDASERAVDNHLTENNAPMQDLKKAEDVTKSSGSEKPNPSEVLSEADLPFKFIPSHLETRPLETIDVFTASIDAKSTAKAIQLINTRLKSPSEDLSYLKRIRSSRKPREKSAKRIKLEEGASSTDSVTMEILLCSCATQSADDLKRLLNEHDLDLQPTVTKVSKFPPLTTRQFSDWSLLWPLSWRVPAQRRVRMARAEFDECEKVMESMLDSAALMAQSPDLPISAVAWDPIQKCEVARSSDLRNTSGHPLKHAIMELVAAVAAHEVIRRLEDPESPARYLCSDLYVFVSHEPCSMCCMALLHSRVAKVFYAMPMTKTGGFESNYGIHWRSELNHRFSVYGGWKRERARYIEEEIHVSEGAVLPEAETITDSSVVDDIDAELYETHPPRAYDVTHDADASDSDLAMEQDDPSDINSAVEARRMIKDESDLEGREDDRKQGSVSNTETISTSHARSQIRRPRPRMIKKVPKMTDFFTKRNG